MFLASHTVKVDSINCKRDQVKQDRWFITCFKASFNLFYWSFGFQCDVSDRSKMIQVDWSRSLCLFKNNSICSHGFFVKCQDVLITGMNTKLFVIWQWYSRNHQWLASYFELNFGCDSGPQRGWESFDLLGAQTNMPILAKCSTRNVIFLSWVPGAPKPLWGPGNSFHAFVLIESNYIFVLITFFE